MTKDELDEIFGWKQGVLCRNKQESINFLTELHNHGYKWWYDGDGNLLNPKRITNNPTIYIESDGYFHRNVKNPHMWVVLRQEVNNDNDCKDFIKITKWSDYMQINCSYCGEELNDVIHIAKIDQIADVEVDIEYNELSVNVMPKDDDYLGDMVSQIHFTVPINYCPICGKKLKTQQVELQELINQENLISDIKVVFGHTYLIFNYDKLFQVKNELEKIFNCLDFDGCVELKEDKIWLRISDILLYHEIDFNNLTKEK